MLMSQCFACEREDVVVDGRKTGTSCARIVMKKSLGMDAQVHPSRSWLHGLRGRRERNWYNSPIYPCMSLSSMKCRFNSWMNKTDVTSPQRFRVRVGVSLTADEHHLKTSMLPPSFTTCIDGSSSFQLSPKVSKSSRSTRLDT